MTEKKKMNIGERIKKIRIWQGMSQSDLAKAIGASSLSYIEKIETNKVIPSIDRLYEIARNLHVGLSDLFALQELKIYEKSLNPNGDYFEVEDYYYKPLAEDSFFYHPAFIPYAVKHKKTFRPIYHRHQGWECVVLRSGKLTVLFRDQQNPNKIVLKETLENPFDVLFFNSSVLHAEIPEQEGTESISILSDVSGDPTKEDQFNIIPHDSTKKYIEEIGPRINEIREAKNKTLKEISDTTNRSQSFISRVELGKVVPGLDCLYEIARALGCTMSDFFTDTKPVCDLFKINLLDNINDNEENDKILIKGELDDYNYKILSGKNTLSYHPSFLPYLITHKRLKNSDEPIYHRHQGWECIILRSNDFLEVRFKDEYDTDPNPNNFSKKTTLEKPFDLLLFNANIPHSYIPIKKEAKSVCIISDTDTSIDNTVIYPVSKRGLEKKII